MLFSLWPSFNAGPLSGRHAAARMALNTLLSLSGSVATAFATSRALRGGTRFDMEHVANSTLAGGAVVSNAERVPGSLPAAARRPACRLHACACASVLPNRLSHTSLD